MIENEATSVEGRLADIIEVSTLRCDEYKISDSDKEKIVLALRQAAMQGEL